MLYPDDEYTITEYDLAGSDRAGNEARYTYDSINRLISVSYPDNTTNSIDYSKWDSDNNGIAESDLIIKTDGAGARTAEYYDKAGRLVKTVLLGKTDSDAEIVTARYEYDSFGNCTLTTDSAGRKVQAEYNKLGQNIKTIADPDGENIVVTYTYDLLGNQLSVTDAEGGKLTYTYDAGSRLSQVQQKLGTGYLTTSYAYDDETSHSGYITNKVTDANGNVKETVFDTAGRKLKDIDVGSAADNTQMTTTYSYDKSRVSTVTRNDGTKEKYTYNTLGQVTRIDYYEAGANTVENSAEYLVYGYDKLGNVTSESIYHGETETTTTYTYDSMGRLAAMTQGSLADGGINIEYTYNGADQVTTVTYVKGVDENNVAAQRILGYTYDNYGRLSAITLKTGSAQAKTVRRYFYKTNGELDYTKDFRNFEAGTEDYIKTAYTVNDLGLTTKITYTDYAAGSTTGTKKEEYTMAYDKRGYITSETSYTNYGTAETVNKTYTYDNVGRLTGATVGDEEKTYTYDSVGNRLTMSDGTDTYAYTYNQFNQLKTVTKNGSAFATYTYDSRGNRTKESQVYMTVGETKYNQVTDYAYDLQNHMTQATITTPEYVNGTVTNTEVIQTNAYNASGQRIRKVEDNETTNYYYMGSALLLSANANNWLLTENILDPGGTIVASARFDDTNPSTAEGFYFYHYDLRGSTTAIVSASGTLQKGYTYDEFGSIEESGNTSFLNEVTFTGSVTDTSTGLQYMNARFYDSAIGSFLSQDTYSGNPYDPWTQNLYTYCGDNPTNMVDPTGHSFIVAVGVMFGIKGK